MLFVKFYWMSFLFHSERMYGSCVETDSMLHSYLEDPNTLPLGIKLVCN